MLSNVKSVARGTIIYGFANVSIKLLGIALIPIYTNHKYLSASDFGVLGMMDTTYQIVIVIFGLSLYQSFARWYYDPEHREAQKSMHFTVMLINALICLVSLIIVIFSADRISELLFDTTKFSRLIWTMFAGSSMNIINSVPMVLLRLQEKAVKYSVISITKLVVTLVFTIFFVVDLHRNVLGVYEAILIGESVVFLILLKGTIKNMVYKLEYSRFLQMMKYGMPLLLATVSSVLLNSFDRFTLNYLTNLETVGIYSLAFRISNTLKVVVITSIQYSLVPILYKKIGDPDHKRFISKSMNYSVFVVTMLALCISMFSQEIVEVFASNKSYLEAASIIPILSFSMIFVLMKENVTIALQIAKSTAIMGILIAFTAVVNLGLNMLFIPKIGIYGSALSSLLSQIIMFTLFYQVAQRKFAIPYEMRNLFVLMMTGLAVYFLSLLSNSWPIVFRIPYKLFLLGLLPFILYPLKFYEKIEVERIKETLIKWFRILVVKKHQQTPQD